MMMKFYWKYPLFICLLLFFVASTTHAGEATFEQNEVVQAAGDFFGSTSEGLGKIIRRAFKKYGRPNAYITGGEVSGAVGIGLRYGKGFISMKKGKRRKVFWQGPSVGFDFGGNVSKVFTLVYHLKSQEQIFQRFPGVDGSFYFVAGFGVNYQQSGDVILAPIRTGVGLRMGANVGYLHYTKKKSWIPF